MKKPMTPADNPTAPVPVGSGALLGHARWKIADILSLIACKLRGQKWYIADNWAGVPGNRAAELKQSVWERCVALELTAENKDPEWLDAIDRELTELEQTAARMPVGSGVWLGGCSLT